jgi:NAD+ kinase
VKVAIVAVKARPRVLAIARRFLDIAPALGIEPVASAIDATVLGLEAEDLNADAGIDLVLAIGGDGTVLDAVRVAIRTGAPVYGINAGHVGFMADGDPGEVDAITRALSGGDWDLSERMLIQAAIGDAEPVAGLNDVVVEKMENQRLVHVNVTVDGESFLTYRADGLVLATPNGSTAYNFSAGGPLIAPEMHAIVLTPVAPHSLFSKSLVLPADTVFGLEIRADRSVGVTVDGFETGIVAPGGCIEVRRAPDVVRFVKLSGRSFTSTVKRKFKLGDI